MLYTRIRTLAGVLAVLGGLCAADSARAHLREDEVLVVYDRRVNESLLVAEAYAGSAKVPGGVGNVAGTRGGVRVVDLANLAGAGVVPATPDISYATFISAIRDPLRSHLSVNGLAENVRSIVLTKGLPHRIMDVNRPTLGDDPPQLNASFSAATFGNFTYASVDSELTLLWQDLSAGEANRNADSKADGMIANPMARKNLPAQAYSRAGLTTSPKLLTAQPIVAVSGGPAVSGFIWQPTAGTTAQHLTPGDVYMVCRLDAPTVQNVRDMLERARDIRVSASGVKLVFDTDGRTLDVTAGLGVPFDTVGSDYGAAATYLTSDGRFPSARVVNNALTGFTQFVVGPGTVYAGGPTVVSEPVLMLASFGANHTGVGAPANTTYAGSYIYAPGAVFTSMESFNGRDFGGRGGHPSIPQEQAADFLATGGTFAIANVWEPFTLSLPHNREIVRSFLLSNLSWAEAAYSSLTVLSWQQVVLGDPLARVTRTAEDLNSDNVVDIEDLYSYFVSPRDVNNSGFITRADSDLLRQAIRGFESVSMRSREAR